MSRHAAFVDAATAIDRTDFDSTFISYYTWGQALGLGLDLTLRTRSNGRISLDDYMRTLWQRHGKPGGRAPGYVDKPYTMTDLRQALAEVSGDAAFAADFFARFIQGRDVMDYAALLRRAGFVLRPLPGSGAYVGNVRLDSTSGGVRVASAAPLGSPLFDAGIDREDVIVALAGVPVPSEGELRRLVAQHKPGDDAGRGVRAARRPGHLHHPSRGGPAPRGGACGGRGPDADRCTEAVSQCLACVAGPLAGLMGSNA